MDRISTPYRAAFNYFCENPFPWHYAVPCHVVDGTPVVAGLADLCYLHHGGLADFKPAPYWNSFPVYSKCCYILGKIAERDIGPFLRCLLDAFRCKKTDLPVPLSGMCIVFKTMIFYKYSLLHALLACALVPAYCY